jgi:hypothetical protein
MEEVVEERLVHGLKAVVEGEPKVPNLVRMRRVAAT